MEQDSDFVVVLARRDGSRKYVTDDPLTVGVVRDLFRTGTAKIGPPVKPAELARVSAAC